MCSQTVASACPRDIKRVESARNALQCVHRVSACSHTPMTATRTHTIPPPRTNTGIATLCVFEACVCGGGGGGGGSIGQCIYDRCMPMHPLLMHACMGPLKAHTRTRRTLTGMGLVSQNMALQSLYNSLWRAVALARSPALRVEYITRHQILRRGSQRGHIT